MKIKYEKQFRIYDVLTNKEEPFMPKTDDEWEIFDKNNNYEEIDILYDDIKMFQEIWWEDFSAYHYGNEMPLLYAFKQFFDSLKEGESGRSYDYQKLSRLYNSEELCWAIITILDRSGFLDWGTSIRFGWLDNYSNNDKAKKIQEMFDKYNISILYEIIHLDFYYKDNSREHVISEQGQ